ncbi:MAG TPA: hypothetical protein VGU23_08690 [Acidobacteriaceae bacterium]|nr:hypothetical protein [Acidobacteriaceae bacterium]
MKAQEEQTFHASADQVKRPSAGNRDADAERICQQTLGQDAAEGYGPGLAYPSGGYPIAGEPPAGVPSQSVCHTATGVTAGALASQGLGDLTHGLEDADAHAKGGSEEQGNGITNADDLSGTTNTDYSSQGDDSMLSDNVASDSSSS